MECTSSLNDLYIQELVIVFSLLFWATYEVQQARYLAYYSSEKQQL